MNSDETYLEAFVENLTTLPHEVRRNMDLLKALHASSPMEKLSSLQREYILNAEKKVHQLEIVELDRQDDDSDDDDKDSGRANAAERNAKRKRYCVRALNDDGTQSSSNPVIVPSTDEFMALTYDAEPYKQIRSLQQDVLQKADEKVAVAQQAFELVDAVVQRLDRDLAAMEKTMLPNEYSEGIKNTAKPDDLAACQVAQGSEWILAKVVHHDPNTGIYKLADEDVESNKVFDLPESQVIVLGGCIDRLTKGDVVFAIYPDTTSFYQATVVQAPRKQGVSGQFVMVNFKDDSDEFGVTHDKAVPLQHVMPPP